jgi:hypothetical protein
MRRHLLEVTKHYVLEVLKVDGNNMDDIETNYAKEDQGLDSIERPNCLCSPISLLFTGYDFFTHLMVF